MNLLYGTRRFYSPGTRRFYLYSLAEYRSPNRLLESLLSPHLRPSELVEVSSSVPVALVIFKRAGYTHHLPCAAMYA